MKADERESTRKLLRKVFDRRESIMGALRILERMWPDALTAPSKEALIHAADRLEHHDDGGGNARFNVKVAEYLRILAVQSK